MACHGTCVARGPVAEAPVNAPRVESACNGKLQAMGDMMRLNDIPHCPRPSHSLPVNENRPNAMSPTPTHCLQRVEYLYVVRVCNVERLEYTLH